MLDCVGRGAAMCNSENVSVKGILAKWIETCALVLVNAISCWILRKQGEMV